MALGQCLACAIFWRPVCSMYQILATRIALGHGVKQLLSKFDSANNCNSFYIHQMEVPCMTTIVHCCDKLRNRKVGK